MRYILLDAKGKLFDSILDNLQFHSLTDLLIELMQLKVSYQLKQETSEDNDDDATNASLNVSENTGLSED